MASTSVTSESSWQEKYEGFIDPDYKFIEEVNGSVLAKRFEKWAKECRDELPKGVKPEDAFMFHVHMTQFYRDMEHAKDSFLRASLAFHAKRNTREDDKE